MYAKIFTSIFDGSMRGHSDLILVFVNMLCHADQDGIVDRHWRAIADETGLPSDRVQAAVAALEGPDKESRSRNDDGRRIKRIDAEREWGWQIVNYGHYRQLRSAEDRREYLREYMRKKRKSATVNTLLTPVNICKQCQPIVEAEAEVKAEPEGRPAPAAGECGIAELVQKIKGCRPEFAALNVMDLENRIRSVPIAAARSGVDDFCRDMVASLTLPAVPGKMLSGYLRKSQPVEKKKPIVSRDSAIRDAVRTLTEASATGDISRCMKALCDKYRDIPPQNGQTVAGEALEIWKFQDKQGREGVRNAPQGVV